MLKTNRTPGFKDDMPGIEAYLSLDFYRAAESEIGLKLISPNKPTTAGWELGVEKAELGTRKQDLQRFLEKRADPTDIAAVTGLVPWISKLLTVYAQSALPV